MMLEHPLIVDLDQLVDNRARDRGADILKESSYIFTMTCVICSIICAFMCMASCSFAWFNNDPVALIGAAIFGAAAWRISSYV